MLTENTYKMVEGYRKTDSIAEIEGLFQYLAKKGYEITVWQTDGNGHRDIMRMHVDTLNPWEPEIRLYPVDKEANLSQLKSDRSLYLHTQFNRVIAECKIVYLGRKHLFIAPPNEIFVWDQKRIPRIKVKSDAPHVAFKKQDKDFECPILDISNTGMAFKVGKNPAKYFSYEEDEIVISRIFKQHLKEKLKGRVVYIKEINHDKTEFRVGVQFLNEIDISTSVPHIL